MSTVWALLDDGGSSLTVSLPSCGLDDRNVVLFIQLKTQI